MSTARHSHDPAEPDNRSAAVRSVADRAAAELARMLDEARIDQEIDPVLMAKECGLTTREAFDVFKGNVIWISDEQLNLITEYCGLTPDQAMYAEQLGKVSRRTSAISPSLSLASRRAPNGPAKSSGQSAGRGIRNVTLLADTDLEILSRADLANTLKRIMKRADLGPAKVALKAGIARSQVYNLIDARRDALPRKPEQIRAFLKACRVTPQHIDALLREWAQLDRKRASRRRLAPPATPVPAPAPTLVDGSDGTAVAIEKQARRARIRFDVDQPLTSIGVLRQSELRNVKLERHTWRDKLMTWCKPRVFLYRCKRVLLFLSPLTPLALLASWFSTKPETVLFDTATWKPVEWALVPGLVLATAVFVVLAVVIQRQRALYRRMLRTAATEPDSIKRSRAALARATLKRSPLSKKRG